MVNAGALHALLLHVSVIALGYLVHITLANLLGPAGYGLYYYILSWVGIIVVVAAFGIPSTVVKFVGQYAGATERASNLSGLVRWSVKTSLLLSAAAVAVWTLFVAAVVEEGRKELFLIGAILIPLLTTTRVSRGLLRAFKFIPWTYAPQLCRHLGILAGCALLFVLARPMDTQAALLVTIVAVSLGLIVAFSRLRTSTAVPAELPNHDHRKEWVSASWPLMLLGSFSLLINQTDILMLGALTTDSDVGVYQAASRTAALAGIVLVTASVAMGPQIAHLHSAGKITSLQKIVRSAAHWIFWPTLVIALLFLLFSEQIVKLFGPEFVAAAPVLSILVVGHVFNAGGGVARELLSYTGFQVEASRLMLMGVVFNVVANAAGILLYGPKGAAIATATTFLLLTIAFVYTSRKKVHVRTDLLGSPPSEPNV